jgi:hypothetical protein
VAQGIGSQSLNEFLQPADINSHLLMMGPGASYNMYARNAEVSQAILPYIIARESRVLCYIMGKVMLCSDIGILTLNPYKCYCNKTLSKERKMTP